MLATKQGITL